MKPPIDEIFERVRAISDRLTTLDVDDPQHKELLKERAQLRADAVALANSARHPRSVETEISMLLARLAEIDDSFITKGYAEKHLTKGFSDPGAYSSTINRKLSEEYANEVSTIEERIAELVNLEPGVDSN